MPTHLIKTGAHRNTRKTTIKHKSGLHPTVMPKFSEDMVCLDKRK